GLALVGGCVSILELSADGFLSAEGEVCDKYEKLCGSTQPPNGSWSGNNCIQHMQGEFDRKGDLLRSVNNRGCLNQNDCASYVPCLTEAGVSFSGNNPGGGGCKNPGDSCGGACDSTGGPCPSGWCCSGLVCMEGHCTQCSQWFQSCNSPDQCCTQHDGKKA